MKPHWEHGYRCHGYWLGMTRIGGVSLPPPGGAVPVDYGWAYTPPGGRTVEGRVKSLREGKRIVERLWDERSDPLLNQQEAKTVCPHCCGLRIGDVVEAVPPNAMACGSGLYPHAVVVSVRPFILISEAGDMVWRATLTPRDVRQVTGRLVSRAAAFARLDREVGITLLGDCQECL